MKDNKKSFIEVVRAELGKTPVEFRKLLGMSRSLYSYYNVGKRGVSQDTVKRIMRAVDGLLSEKQRNNILRQFFS